MRALVFGGCGFIGSHVVDALIAQGHFVRVLDRQPKQSRPANSGGRILLWRLRRSNGSDRGADGGRHGVSSGEHHFPGTANLDPKADIRDNLIDAISLLDSMVDLKVGRIVFLSSGGTVYGVPDCEPVPEDHPLRPGLTPMASVKVAMEHYLDMYRKLRGVSSVVLRASNPYGPRQAHSGVQGVISTFLKRVHDGEAIEISGDGSVVRDYLHVIDLAALCVSAAVSDCVGPFNAGSGEGRSLNQILRCHSLRDRSCSHASL